MGKIRVSTIGDESAEKAKQEELKKKREAKKADAKKDASQNDAVVTPVAEDVEAPTEEKKKKKEKFIVKKASPRSKNYNKVVTLVDKNKIYKLKDAVALLPQLKTAKFDETVELHINTIEQGISGSFTLPHGTGKKTRVAIVSAAKDPKALEELIASVEAGKIEFDILIATPDSMPKLAKVARYLGPKGLMPNPKNGTVTPRPEEVAKKFEAGQINYKTEAKAPIIHLTVGKVSFTADQLMENITTALRSVQAGKAKSVTLKSTMSPGIKIDFASL